MSILVICVGNAYRGDDAAALEVAERLEGLPEDVRVEQREGEPSRLLSAWEGADAVVLVDAVSSGAGPGTLHRYDASEEPLPSALFGATSTHALGLAETVELARALGTLPQRTIVIGIEGESFTAGAGLSPQVESRLAAAVAAVLEEVEACTSRR